MKISLIGCGAIGRNLATSIDSGAIDNADLVAIFDVDRTAVEKLRLNLHDCEVASFSSFTQLARSQEFKTSDIVVEAASQNAVRQYGKRILDSKKDLMLMSVGALSDDSLCSELLDIAASNKNRILIPTGAIAGLDAIRSVRGLLDSVTLITTKNPKALTGAPFFDSCPMKLEAIKESTLLYRGNARDAARKFPANINVAVALGLAGLGLTETTVEIVADPRINENQHCIKATGQFGEITTTVRSVPTPGNSKTSALAVLSAIECLRQAGGALLRVGS